MERRDPDLVPPARPSHSLSGVLYGAAAYIFWGFVPLYFKAVAHVPPLEVLAHRIVWSVVLLYLWMSVTGRLRAVRDALARRRTVVTLLSSTVLVSINWLIFIWAVFNDQVLQASLGYFINPLVNVLLGFIFLGERLRRLQVASVLLAAIGVTTLTVSYGQVPVIALGLAGSFGLYGLLRKVAPVDGVTGLTVETTLASPLALAYLVHLGLRGRLVFGSGSTGTDVLLILSGVVTALPLLWFANAARRLRLATLGFIQYLAPSLQFGLAVVAFHEPLTRPYVIAFACIWLALFLYTVDSVRAARVRPLLNPRRSN